MQKQVRGEQDNSAVLIFYIHAISGIQIVSKRW